MDINKEAEEQDQIKVLLLLKGVTKIDRARNADMNNLRSNQSLNRTARPIKMVWSCTETIWEDHDNEGHGCKRERENTSREAKVRRKHSEGKGNRLERSRR